MRERHAAKQLICQGNAKTAFVRGHAFFILLNRIESQAFLLVKPWIDGWCFARNGEGRSSVMNQELNPMKPRHRWCILDAASAIRRANRQDAAATAAAYQSPFRVPPIRDTRSQAAAG